VALVISPLKALMSDQLSKLQALGLPAVALTGASTAGQRAAVYAQLEGAAPPRLKLLFLAPEQLAANQRLRGACCAGGCAPCCARAHKR